MIYSERISIRILHDFISATAAAAAAVATTLLCVNFVFIEMVFTSFFFNLVHKKLGSS